ncbi:hypothetical protein ACIQGZ_20015 [Streptomyces sp. NPDC092296]|uniref:DUF7848 domain-containing protein n=1 Tax=Streptomyces sp. NPDC092296 TaxID=3366012 RepID=UPI003816FED7
MTRTVFRFVDHTVTPDTAPDAPPTWHRFRCLGEDEAGRACGAQSPGGEDFAAEQRWTFEHFRDHRDHTSYAQATERPWLIVPGRTGAACRR